MISLPCAIKSLFFIYLSYVLTLHAFDGFGLRKIPLPIGGLGTFSGDYVYPLV